MARNQRSSPPEGQDCGTGSRLRRFGRCAQKYGRSGDGTYRRGTSAAGEGIEKCQSDDYGSVVGYRQSGEGHGQRTHSN